MRGSRPEARYAAALALFAILTFSPAAIFWRIYHPRRPPAPIAAPASGVDGPVASFAEPSVTRAPQGRAGAPVVERAASIETPPRPWLDTVVSTLPWLWLVGSAATLTLLVAGLAGIEHLRRSSLVVEGDTQDAAAPGRLPGSGTAGGRRGV